VTGAATLKQRPKDRPVFRRGNRFDKYRIAGCLAAGPVSAVYKAHDTIEGIDVALKIPHPHLVDDLFLEDFLREARLSARLVHPNILPLKYASFIEGRFVIALPLGEQTLADRLKHRIALGTVLDYAEQALDALRFAHSKKVIHCDIKPENFILFGKNRLCLADFGISKVAMRTLEASGSGTVGYMAPEQAMGRPSFKSDVFSFGLVLYRMLTGQLPRWPYEWPPPGYDRIRNRLHPEFLKLVNRAMEFEPANRYRNAGHMMAAFERVKKHALTYSRSRRPPRQKKGTGKDWKDVQRRQFRREFGRVLEIRFACQRCGGPVSEAMKHCAWCGLSRKIFRDETRFPERCPRCGRGVKKDWSYCPWCFGPGFEDVDTRHYTDVRYQGKCHSDRCGRKSLMPFMRYCPWCRRSVKRSWMIPGSKERCPSCRWGFVSGFWNYCPWCGKKKASP